MKTKLKIHFLIIAISLTSLLGGYVQSLSAPIYASDDWQTLTSNEQLVDAFRAYCKSRNTVIEGSLLDAVTSFTTTTFNNLCNTLGVDVTLLQAELQRSYTGSGYKYAFSQLGLSTYNRIFAEFLQNNDLSVGDTVDDKILYSGEFFTDADGYTALVWDLPSASQSYSGNKTPNKYGNKYKYDGYDVKSSNIATLSFNILRINDTIYNISETVTHSSSQDNLSDIYSTRRPGYSDGWPWGVLYALDLNNSIINGSCIVYRVNNGSTLYVGQFVDFRGSNTNGQVTANCRWMNFDGFTSPDGLESADVSITTNNYTINNETVINEGDTYIIDSDGQPGGGGSGGGSDDDDWDPSVPTIPPAGGGTGNNNTINWPDIDIPDFNLPDFSLGDITDKFPFSIPFDLVALLTVLDGEPIAPHIEGSIPLGSFYTWDLDFDFSQFDNYARIFRAFEFIGFCIGLIYFTVRIVKG